LAGLNFGSHLFLAGLYHGPICSYMASTASRLGLIFS
jgi:hypothetical protein